METLVASGDGAVGEKQSIKSAEILVSRSRNIIVVRKMPPSPPPASYDDDVDDDDESL